MFIKYIRLHKELFLLTQSTQRRSPLPWATGATAHTGCRNKVCHIGLWTLSRRHIQAKVWKCPLHIRGRSTRAIAPLERGQEVYVFKIYAWQPAGLRRTTFARFYKLDVQSLASQVLSVSNWFMLLPFLWEVLLVQYITQPSMRLYYLSALSSVPRTWSCYHMLLNTVNSL